MKKNLVFPQKWSGLALKSSDRTSTYNLLTNIKMDPKNL